MLCLEDDVDHNNSKGMQTKVYEYNFTNNCNKTKQTKLKKIVQLIQTENQPRTAASPSPLVLLLRIKRYFSVSVSPAPHTRPSALEVAFLICRPAPLLHETTPNQTEAPPTPL